MNRFIEYERQIIRRLFQYPMKDYYMKSFMRIWKQLKSIKFTRDNNGNYISVKPFNTADINNVKKVNVIADGVRNDYYLVHLSLYGDGELPMTYQFGMKH